MKVYIAGKITGDPNYKGKFAAEAEKIRAAGAHCPESGGAAGGNGAGRLYADLFCDD